MSDQARIRVLCVDDHPLGTDIEDRKQAEERVRNENLALREEIDCSSMFEEIVGSSLVEQFTRRFATRAGKSINKISKKTLSLLKSWDQPGNVRELQNVVERAVIVSDSGVLYIDEQWLPGPQSRPRVTTAPPPRTLASQENDAIEVALMKSKGRVAGPYGAASRLGIHSSTMESKIRVLNIDKRRFKPQQSPTGALVQTFSQQSDAATHTA